MREGIGQRKIIPAKRFEDEKTCTQKRNNKKYLPKWRLAIEIHANYSVAGGRTISNFDSLTRENFWRAVCRVTLACVADSLHRRYLGSE